MTNVNLRRHKQIHTPIVVGEAKGENFLTLFTIYNLMWKGSGHGNVKTHGCTAYTSKYRWEMNDELKFQHHRVNLFSNFSSLKRVGIDSSWLFLQCLKVFQIGKHSVGQKFDSVWIQCPEIRNNSISSIFLLPIWPSFSVSDSRIKAALGE